MVVTNPLPVPSVKTDMKLEGYKEGLLGLGDS